MWLCIDSQNCLKESGLSLKLFSDACSSLAVVVAAVGKQVVEGWA